MFMFWSDKVATTCICSLQDVVNVLVRDCGPRFFSLCLPGCLLLTLDFIKAAGTIISTVDYKEVLSLIWCI